MTMWPGWLKRLVKRSKTLTALYTKLITKIHWFKDWWGAKIWTRTTEVVTPLGFKLTSSFHPAYQLMRVMKFEVEETTLFTRLLPQMDLFVDVGANIGYYTCLALQSGKPVVAFEPQQQNLRCLFQNLMANGWQDRAEIYPVALSGKPGLVTLYGASGLSSSLIRNWAGRSPRYKQIVPVSTLDIILAGRLVDKRLFIKIDVEGAEYRVLEGARSTLIRTPKPIWLVEVCLHEFHPEGVNPDYEKLFNLFWESGYHAYTASENLKRVTRDHVDRWVTDKFCDSGTFNYLFVGSELSEIFDA